MWVTTFRKFFEGESKERETFENNLHNVHLPKESEHHIKAILVISLSNVNYYDTAWCHYLPHRNNNHCATALLHRLYTFFFFRWPLIQIISLAFHKDQITLLRDEPGCGSAWAKTSPLIKIDL